MEKPGFSPSKPRRNWAGSKPGAERSTARVDELKQAVAGIERCHPGKKRNEVGTPHSGTTDAGGPPKRRRSGSREDGLSESRIWERLEAIWNNLSSHASNGSRSPGPPDHSVHLRKSVPGRRQFFQPSATAERRIRRQEPLVALSLAGV